MRRLTKVYNYLPIKSVSNIRGKWFEVDGGFFSYRKFYNIYQRKENGGKNSHRFTTIITCNKVE